LGPGVEHWSPVLIVIEIINEVGNGRQISGVTGSPSVSCYMVEPSNLVRDGNPVGPRRMPQKAPDSSTQNFACSDGSARFILRPQAMRIHAFLLRSEDATRSHQPTDLQTLRGQTASFFQEGGNEGIRGGDGGFRSYSHVDQA
jgi:hypothetical protein